MWFSTIIYIRLTAGNPARLDGGLLGLFLFMLKDIDCLLFNGGLMYSPFDNHSRG